MPLSEGRRSPNTNVVYPSRLDGINYLDRIDPLHEVQWADAVRTKWYDISLTRHVLRLSQSGFLVHKDQKEWSAIDVSPSRQYRPNSIRVMAMLAQYHQLSTMQIASLLDTTIEVTWNVMISLFEAGVIERCIPEWWDEDDERPHGGTGSLWRIDTQSPQVDAWLDGLTHLEYLLLTGGVDVTKGTPGAMSASAARHNLTLAELTLRAMEMCPGVIGAWGEPHATADHLLTTQDDDIRKNIADGVIVGKDGRMVVLETSGKSNLDDGRAGQNIQRKAAAWAAIAMRSELDLTILFVDISQSAKIHRLQYHVMRGVEQAGEYLTRRADQERAKDKVFVADAKEWFPVASMVTEGFLTLESFNPFSRMYHDLLPTGLQVDSESDVVINTLGSLHTPLWINREASSMTHDGQPATL